MTEIIPLSASKCISDTGVGYPIELFLPNTILQHLRCRLCHGILIEPVDLKCEDKVYTYCKECLSNYFEQTDKCPVCESKTHFNGISDNIISVSKTPLIINQALDNIIDSLEVKCKFQPAGCTWTGKIKDLYGYEEKEHLKECKYNIIKCTNEECKEIVHGNDLESHLTACAFTIVTCECRKRIMRKEMKIHIADECPYTFIECKLCKTGVRRDSMNKHLNEFCSETEVDCPYKKYGCTDKIKRKDVNEHMNKSGVKHMNLRIRTSEPIQLSMYVDGNATPDACEQKIKIFGVPYLITNYRDLSSLNLSIAFTNLGDHTMFLRFSMNPSGTKILEAGQFDPNVRKQTFLIPNYHRGTIHTILTNVEEWIP